MLAINQITQSLYQFSGRKISWGILAISALGLLVAALVFQHVYGHAPCIKCIYQRTAVIGIFIAAIVPLLYNHWLTRLSGFAIWAYSAAQGLASAREHLDVINATNPFFTSCEFVPNFPSFMPLHEWMPAIFDATGECNDNRWQFLGMGMASWMQIIFSIYLVVLAIILLAHVSYRLKNKK